MQQLLRRVLRVANMVDEVMIRSHVQPQQTSQQQRCGGHGALSCSGRTPRVHVAPFLDACFSTLHILFIKTLSTLISEKINGFKLWQ